jgi:4a-hydroxytetrahydrobiopterin dehydratase
MTEAGGWSETSGALTKDLRFEDFAAALAYVNRVGELAERENHHPDILIHGWNRVRLTLFTHSEDRITDADHRMAAAIDALD